MPTYQKLRRMLAQEIGPFGAFTASNGVASFDEAVCPGAFDSTELASTAFAYQWFYRNGSTDVAQRRIKGAGLTVGTDNPGQKVIKLDGPLGTAIEAGTTFELFGRLPATTTQTAGGTTVIMGLLECLNAALHHILVPDLITLPLVSGRCDYVLEPAWLDRASRLVEVRAPDVRGTKRIPSWRTWRIDEQVDGPILHVDAPWTFTSGAPALELRVLRPAWTRIKVADTWVDSTVGLHNDADECGSDETAIVTVAKAFAYQALRESRAGGDRARYDMLYERQVQLARAVRGYDKDNDVDPAVPKAPLGQAATGRVEAAA
jgi:hypothetical protein